MAEIKVVADVMCRHCKNPEPIVKAGSGITKIPRHRLAKAPTGIALDAILDEQVVYLGRCRRCMKFTSLGRAVRRIASPKYQMHPDCPHCQCWTTRKPDQKRRVYVTTVHKEPAKRKVRKKVRR